ncbi:acyl-CoA thioesterase [Candidatus Sumerlaeota bacterium]|nr:acyl-CoA thioesterase [Candidatus Sumerlaeota bacterium]
MGYDIDYAGVVSNIVHIRWLEDLRMAILDDHLPLDGLLTEGLSPAVIGTRIDYIRAIRLFDRPIGRMWMSEIGPIRWRVEAEFTLGGEVAARAEQTGVFIDVAKLRPIRIPTALREQFEREVASSEP